MDRTPSGGARGPRYAAGILAAALSWGCGGGGEADTAQPYPMDAGPDAYVVILDGGGTVDPPPDGVAACPDGLCNYQSGEGCSGATPSCVPTVTPGGIGPACLAAGAGVSGSPCDANAAVSGCAAGYVCAEQTCHKLCCGGDWTGCPSADEHCFRSLKYSVDGAAVDTGAWLCYPVNTCDALVPSSCSQPGTTCQIVDPTGATACIPEGTGAVGEPCPCKGGSLCVDGQCRRLCKAAPGGGEPYCQPGEGACVHFNRDPAGVGECTP